MGAAEGVARIFRRLMPGRLGGGGKVPFPLPVLPVLPVLPSARGRVRSGAARGRRGIKARVDEPGAKGAVYTADCLRAG